MHQLHVETEEPDDVDLKPLAINSSVDHDTSSLFYYSKRSASSSRLSLLTPKDTAHKQPEKMTKEALI
jgi:hypothetical protein